MFDQLSQSLKDNQVKSKDIKPEYAMLSTESLIKLMDEVPKGEYISILNDNNLSKVIIYRRRRYSNDIKNIPVWDGVTSDTSWYNTKSSMYVIANANQFAGFRELVNSGVTFKNKIVKLISPINLGYHSWKPIGGEYDIKKSDSNTGIFYRCKLDKEHTFQGTFDGSGYGIHGLKIDNPEKRNVYMGLFESVYGAIIKNVVLSHVDVGEEKDRAGFSALVGVAQESRIVNVIVSGKITGQCCSSICGVALDTSFYDCVNRASLIGSVSETRGRIVIGGFVQQFGLSTHMIRDVKGGSLNAFNNCIQYGEIKINATNANKIVAGQLFGYISYDTVDSPYSISIHKCNFDTDKFIEVYNFDEEFTRGVFYGSKNGSEPITNVTCINSKIDLVNGLIGQSNSNIGITINKITISRRFGNMVVPGSINTMYSKKGERYFTTVDTSSLLDTDGIYNLEPYFCYVKTEKI